jgi:integrase
MDIKTLTLDQIDWGAETITINQSKSGMRQQLPLTDEIGTALIDYLKHVRPESRYREVFLKLRGPCKPFSDENHLHAIVRYWRSVAGIRFRSPQKHGLHSLRHTLATHLLEEDVPFSLIADILGHASMNTTMIYAKASVESLREVALPLPEVEDV